MLSLFLHIVLLSSFELMVKRGILRPFTRYEKSTRTVESAEAVPRRQWVKRS